MHLSRVVTTRRLCKTDVLSPNSDPRWDYRTRNRDGGWGGGSRALFLYLKQNNQTVRIDSKAICSFKYFPYVGQWHAHMQKKKNRVRVLIPKSLSWIRHDYGSTKLHIYFLVAWNFYLLQTQSRQAERSLNPDSLLFSQWRQDLCKHPSI